jgi:hypothetical protein
LLIPSNRIKNGLATTMRSGPGCVLEPVFEADFLPCSFGFRPKRSAHDALQVGGRRALLIDRGRLAMFSIRR